MTPDIKRILVPLDFSTNSARALDYAHGLAVKFDAALHLVHVCEVPSMMTPALDAYAIAYADWSQRLGEEAEKELIKITPALADVKVTTEVLFGPPASAIVEAAGTNKVDLIVMGTHGHGAVMHALMGNVAERVVRTASCPVLTIREPKLLNEPVVAKSTFAGIVASILVAGVMLAPGLVTTAIAQDYAQTTTGREVFRTYCASCHGADCSRRWTARQRDDQEAGESDGDCQAKRRPVSDGPGVQDHRRPAAGARARRPGHAGVGRCVHPSRAMPVMPSASRR